MRKLGKAAASLFRSCLTLISPRVNTAVTYRIKFGKALDLDNPRTLNEKILWLKFNTYWENELVRQCADKFRVREYVREAGCEEALCKLFGVFDSVYDIDWSNLPTSFALKLNVGCGRNLIVPDSSHLDVATAKRKVASWFRDDAWLGYSEMQYKGVPMKLVMEECLCSHDGALPEDYKFYCMNGRARYVMLCVGRGESEHPSFYYYDRDWNLMPYTKAAIANPGFLFEKPDGIDEAFDYAERLSKPFPFVRVDFYIVEGKVYFGELTFTPSAGMDNGRLPETDRMLGDELILPAM